MGVEYHVLVDPDSEGVDIYRLEGGEYKQAAKFHRDGEYTFDLGFCRAKLDFSKIWR